MDKKCCYIHTYNINTACQEFLKARPKLTQSHDLHHMIILAMSSFFRYAYHVIWTERRLAPNLQTRQTPCKKSFRCSLSPFPSPFIIITILIPHPSPTLSPPSPSSFSSPLISTTSTDYLYSVNPSLEASGGYFLPQYALGCTSQYLVHSYTH